MDDVRYSELVFLRALAEGSPRFQHFWGHHGEQATAVGLHPMMYVEMAVTLLEDLYVRFDDHDLQLLVRRLSGEIAPEYKCPQRFHSYQWMDPRPAIYEFLMGQAVQRLLITYRGLRRIEELRELLSRERILEPFGVLLSIQYLRRDLEDALRRAPEVAVSVLYVDLDNFKPINTRFGQAGGDIVMKRYLEVVRESLGLLGTGYRGVGDEVVGLVIGQGHKRVVELAEKIRESVGAMQCEYQGQRLPSVTASLGVATTPPEPRRLDVETVAEDRKRRAKEEGRNRVIAAA